MILFVCAGNICRSVALHAVLQKQLPDIYVDSCGIDATFLGSDPDRRMMEEINRCGYTIKHKAKLFEPSYLAMYDYIFPVTKEYERYLSTLASPEEKKKIFLATSFTTNEDIPDPYSVGGFDHVMDIIVKAADGIKNFLTNK